MAVAGELESLPFGSLIGGPLDAAIKAQAQAALSSVNFIQQVGFKEDRSVEVVTFKAKKGDTETEITVPLLTIVPIPFIRIDEMTIDFKANVTSSTESESKTMSSSEKAAKVSAGGSYLFVSASLEASISSKKDSESTKNSKYSVETTIDVHVHAVQDELPAGLAKMLNILTDTIESLPSGGGEGGEENPSGSGRQRTRQR